MVFLYPSKSELLPVLLCIFVFVLRLRVLSCSFPALDDFQSKASGILLYHMLRICILCNQHPQVQGIFLPLNNSVRYKQHLNTNYLNILGRKCVMTRGVSLIMKLTLVLGRNGGLPVKHLNDVVSSFYCCDRCSRLQTALDKQVFAHIPCRRLSTSKL